MKKDTKETIGGMIAFVLICAVVLFFAWLIFMPHDVEVWECRNCGRVVRMNSIHLPKSPALVCNGCGMDRLVFDHIEGQSR